MFSPPSNQDLAGQFFERGEIAKREKIKKKGNKIVTRNEKERERKNKSSGKTNQKNRHNGRTLSQQDIPRTRESIP